MNFWKSLYLWGCSYELLYDRRPSLHALPNNELDVFIGQHEFPIIAVEDKIFVETNLSVVDHVCPFPFPLNLKISPSTFVERRTRNPRPGVKFPLHDFVTVRNRCRIPKSAEGNRLIGIPCTRLYAHDPASI